MKYLVRFLMICLLLSSVAFAETTKAVYKQAKATSKLVEKYDAKNALGKEIYEVHAFRNNSIITVYVGLDVATRVQFDMPLSGKPGIASGDLFQISYKEGNNYFDIKPVKKGYMGVVTNTHVICKPEGTNKPFTIPFYFKIVDSSQANVLVLVHDGETSGDESEKSVDYWKIKNSKLLDQSEDAKYISNMFNFSDNVNRYEVNEYKEHNNVGIELKNITHIDDKYLCNIVVDLTEKQYEIEKEDVRFITKNFKKGWFMEHIKDEKSFNPVEIIKTKNDDKMFVTLLFVSQKIDPEHFYGKLYIKNEFVWETKNNKENEVPFDIFDNYYK
jgi:hypothetical protein